MKVQIGVTLRFVIEEDTDTYADAKTALDVARAIGEAAMDGSLNIPEWLNTEMDGKRVDIEISPIIQSEDETE